MLTIPGTSTISRYKFYPLMAEVNISWTRRGGGEKRQLYHFPLQRVKLRRAIRITWTLSVLTSLG